MEVEGRIQSLSGSCPDLSLTIGGTRVLTNQGTDFKKIRCGDLRVGMDVKAKGPRLSSGAIRAERIERD